MAVIRGKAFWAKILGDPVPGYDPDQKEWTIDVTVDDEARATLEELGLGDKIKNKTDEKPDDERGDFITFKRKALKSDGTEARPIRVVDRKKNEWPQDKLIGNGSEVFVQFAVNEWEYRGRSGVKPGIMSVMVVDHVPYESSDELPDLDEDDEFDEVN